MRKSFENALAELLEDAAYDCVMPEPRKIARPAIKTTVFARNSGKFGYGSYTGPNTPDRQVNILRKRLNRTIVQPSRSLCDRARPESSDNGWYVLLRWQNFGATYSEATNSAVSALSRTYGIKFQNMIPEIQQQQLRELPRKVALQKAIFAQYRGHENTIVAGQFGIQLRGCSALQARLIVEGQYRTFGLGLFEAATWLLANPKRLTSSKQLRICCFGDEYFFQNGEPAVLVLSVKNGRLRLKPKDPNSVFEGNSFPTVIL